MATIASDGTQLAITVMGVPKYSARGLQQFYTPIDAAKVIRRTIQMTARNIALPQAKKYNIEISATDVAPPSLDSVWPGLQVVVDCIAELSYPSGGSPGRSVVSGSSVTENGFVRYRPQMTALVVDLSCGAEEWTAGKPWRLALTEV